MKKELSFSALYENTQEILWHPEQYKSVVSHFSAGAHGACAFQAAITAAELVGCWQHEEYQTRCPKCKETSYITRWAGSCSSGGYWAIYAYCPYCGEEHQPLRKLHPVHWTKMRDIALAVRNELESNRYANYISVPDAFKRDGWECCHKFMAGNCWKKGEDEVTWLLDKIKFNGKEVDKEFIHRMLNIDKRYLEMCDFLDPEHQLHSEYGRTLAPLTLLHLGQTNKFVSRSTYVTFFEGVKWADSTPLVSFNQESTQSLNFAIVSEAFEKEGWENHHAIAGYNRWTKDGLEVKSVRGEYKMDEKTLDAAQLCELLHIDRRILQVSKAIAPYPIHAEFGQAFLAGVRWADAHPIGQR